MNMFKSTVAKSPEDYIEMQEEGRREEMRILFENFKKWMPGDEPFIISGMIGFHSFHYKSKSGREGDWPLVALASQKNYISVYICAIEDGEYLADKNKGDFPKASVGKSCIRFKRVSDIDLGKLENLVERALKAPKFGF